MTRVAVLDDYQEVALEMADWDSLPDDVSVDVFQDHLTDESDLSARLAPYEVVVAMRERTPFQRSLLERLPNLRLLVTTGMRNASIDIAAAADNGITVCGTDGVPYPTAELTWGLILALLRKIPTEDSATRNGRWQVTVGEGLHGKTLGVIGLGRLGSQVATVGVAFGMNVIAWSQNLTSERAGQFGATLVTKQQLLETSDIVTIHVVLSARTRGLIGAADFSSMKSLGISRQHVARANRGRIGPYRRPHERYNCGRRPRRVRHRAAAPGSSSPVHSKHCPHPTHGLRDRRDLPGLLRGRCRQHQGFPGRQPGARDFSWLNA